MTRNIRSLVEASPLSPLQGELKFSTMEYSINLSRVGYCDQSVLVKTCGSSQDDGTATSQFRRQDVAVSS